MSNRWTIIDSLNRRRVAVVVTTLGMAAAATGAVSLYSGNSNSSCLPISARFDAADGSFVLGVCGELPTPLAGSRVALRYDLQLRVGVVIPVAELFASPKIDSARR